MAKTEEEWKKKYCPLISTPMGFTRCRGSECAFWYEDKTLSDQSQSTLIKFGSCVVVKSSTK